MSKIKKVQTLNINVSTVHWISGTNRYRYNFPAPLDLRGKNAKLMMYQYSMNNIIFNITQKLGNNKISIIWPRLNGYTTYNYTIPDGYYSFEDLNTFLQYCMTRDKLYLVNSTNASDVKWFLQITTNAPQQVSQIDSTPLPTTLPTGYVIPLNSAGTAPAWSLSTVSRYPQLILNDLLAYDIFGFTTQRTFPSSNVPLSTGLVSSTISNKTPNLNPTICYLLTCNMVDAKLSPIPNLFFSIPINNPYGKILSGTVGTTGTGISVIETIYNYIEFSLLDMNYNTFVPIDPAISLTVIVEISDEEK